MIAEKLRKSVEVYDWTNNHTSQALFHININIGVANSIDIVSEGGGDLGMLIHKADDLLHQAKAQGRDQVCI